MTLVIDGWIIPTIITICSFIAAWAFTPSGGGDYDFSPLLGCVLLPLAGCVSLLAWLIWALAA